jgi:hypothetical protein
MIDLVLAVAGVAVILAELFIWEPESFGMSRNVTGATFRLLDDRAMSIYPDHSLGLSVPRRRLLVLVRRLIIPIAGLFIFVACPGVCFGSDPVSSVSFNGPKAQAELSRKASNGYSILFEVNRGKASLTARSDEGTVIYSGKGSLVNGRIHFGLGKLGRINARFKPNGSVDRLRPPKSCKGREQVVRGGAFVGSIKFRGESGYTRLNTHRVHGSMASPRSWKCLAPPPGSRSENAASLPAVLGAFTPHRRVVFIAIGGSELLPMRFFIAGTSERYGALRINRSALVEGNSVSFDVLDGLSSATVSSPEPFAGTASFKRNADGSTDWFGTLSVALPGIESTALTGPTFTANLAMPRTEQEFSELLGLS